jgi:hypothetical protein
MPVDSGDGPGYFYFPALFTVRILMGFHFTVQILMGLEGGLFARIRSISKVACPKAGHYL